MVTRSCSRDVDSLTKICQSLILKYTHHVVWRQLDPPNTKWPDEFQPQKFAMKCQLPGVRREEEKNPDTFRHNLRLIRNYFSENLVRPVYNSLTDKCVKFVTNNLLQHGDIILQMIFQDDLSKSLVINAKHIVYRRWSIREERTLQRYLTTSGHHLVTIKLPGAADDKLLQIISAACPQLEELDVSHSCVTDTGLLAVCGVSVSLEATDLGPGGQGSHEATQTRGSYDKETGRFVRAAASRAIKDIRDICAHQQQTEFLKELAQGTSAFQALKQNFPDIVNKSKPMILRRKDSDFGHSWTVGNKKYAFTEAGCRKLKYLDILATNFPKSTITRTGDMKSNLGITKEAVLFSSILLKDLTNLKYNDMGDVLQLFDFVYISNQEDPPQLKLNYFSESRLTLDKLSVARKLCPSLTSLDISMFNFSFFDPETALTSGGENYHKFSESSRLLFEFSKLKDLEMQYMDDSKIFHNCLNTSATNLTRLCLNKMISISFESLSSIKEHCQKLEVLDVYVDRVFTFQEQTPVEQTVAETKNFSWNSLKSLKLGGSIPTGSILAYLISG